MITMPTRIIGLFKMDLGDGGNGPLLVHNIDRFEER